MTRRALISASTPCLRACLFDTLTALLEEEMRRPVDVVLRPESRLREKNTRPISSMDRLGIITLRAEKEKDVRVTSEAAAVRLRQGGASGRESLNQQRWN